LRRSPRRTRRRARSLRVIVPENRPKSNAPAMLAGK
jgi:hypothetical protein